MSEEKIYRRRTRGDQLYHKYRRAWDQLRAKQLKKDPFCAYCLEFNVYKAANVVDHKIPHKGDMNLFKDPENLQSLCVTCHNRYKQRQEATERNYQKATKVEMKKPNYAKITR